MAPIKYLLIINLFQHIDPNVIFNYHLFFRNFLFLSVLLIVLLYLRDSIKSARLAIERNQENEKNCKSYYQDNKGKTT